MNSDLIITIIAVGITIVAGMFFVWLGRFLRDRVGYSQEQIGETSTQAVLIGKYLVESQSADTPMMGALKFRCDNGQEVAFKVDLKIYEDLEEGQKGELLYRGNIFLSFDDPEKASNMDLLEVEAMDYSFTAYDDDIDHEIPHGYSRHDLALLEGKIEPGQSEQVWYELYRKNRRLPSMIFQLKGKTDDLEKYPVLQLLSRSTVPIFLKADKGLQAHLQKVYATALEQLRTGSEQRGAASDGLIVERNLFFLQVMMQEHPKPYHHQIGARLYVNPKRKRKRKINYDDYE